MTTMTAADTIIETLAAALDVDVLHVDWLAQKLERAGLLPPEGEPLLPLHAARLLVATMGSSRPLEAVAAVEAYEALPARSMALSKPTGFGDTTQIIIPVENVPLTDDERELFAELTQSFIGALAAVIFIYAGWQELPTTACPEQIQIRRGLHAPHALLFLGPCPTAPEGRRALSYCLPVGSGRSDYVGGLEVWANTRGSILIELGAALAGRAMAGVHNV